MSKIDERHPADIIIILEDAHDKQDLKHGLGERIGSKRTGSRPSPVAMRKQLFRQYGRTRQPHMIVPDRLFARLGVRIDAAIHVASRKIEKAIWWLVMKTA